MNWQDLAISLAVALLGIAIGLALVTAARARQWGRRQRPGAGGTVTDIDRLRSDVAELAGQLEDFARLIDKTVDQRLGQLRSLLAEADSRIRQLERLVADASGGQPPPAQAAQADMIIAMAAQGLDSVEIARRLGIDVGQVELTLHLRRARTHQQAVGGGRK